MDKTKENHGVEFHTLEYSSALEKAGYTREQARAFTYALVRALHEVKYGYWIDENKKKEA